MDLATYQIKSREIAVYPNVGDNYIYPMYGLIGEFGELAEKLKKIYRDRDGLFTEEDFTLLQLELSDIYWYVAQLATEWGIELPILRGVGVALELHHVMFSAASSIGKIAAARWSGKTEQAYAIRLLLGNLEAIAYYLGTNVSDVLDMNTEKLQSRKQRGVLKGSGDVR